MKIFVLKLYPKQDLKEEIINFVKKNNIRAGFILTGVGSLTRATLRMADTNIIKDFEKKFEINSLSGTLSLDGAHLHISVSDETGKEIGGHVKKGCLIYITAEIIIGEIENTKFSREFNKKTGFKELIISRSK